MTLQTTMAHSQEVQRKNFGKILRENFLHTEIKADRQHKAGAMICSRDLMETGEAEVSDRQS